MPTQQNKVVIVTGGGQGIGRAMAERFLRDGMSVLIAEADDEAGRETAADFSNIGEIVFEHADVSQEADVQRVLAAVEQRWGRLDALINNAAIHDDAPLGDLTLDQWNRVIAVNLTGPFLFSKLAAPLLSKCQGSIVNIASTRALQSESEKIAYGASKGGLLALTHALAMNLAPCVRVNCISPGWIEVSDWKKRSAREAPRLSHEDHAQHPAGRVGTPEDVAALAAYLIGREAAFITGANFVIDGGMTRKMIYV